MLKVVCCFNCHAKETVFILTFLLRKSLEWVSILSGHKVTWCTRLGVVVQLNLQFEICLRWRHLFYLPLFCLTNCLHKVEDCKIVPLIQVGSVTGMPYCEQQKVNACSFLTDCQWYCVKELIGTLGFYMWKVKIEAFVRHKKCVYFWVHESAAFPNVQVKHFVLNWLCSLACEVFCVLHIITKTFLDPMFYVLHSVLSPVYYRMYK
jgi:hypothetical protein